MALLSVRYNIGLGWTCTPMPMILKPKAQIHIHLSEEIYLSIFHFIIRMQSVARTRRAEPERLAHQQEHLGARWRLVWIGWHAIASGWIV